MCNKQVDTENRTPNVYHVTAAQPGRPVNWQYVSTGGRQNDTLVPPPTQCAETASAGAFCSMIDHRAAMSDGGNSRDSCSSTSSNIVGCQPVQPAVQPWSTYYCPPWQPTQYRGHVNRQQQYHLYHRAHHHTWGQVETNQSRCGQVYPQQRQRFHCTNQRAHSGQPTQHQYLQSTSSVHPYHPYSTPSASYPGTTSDMTAIQQVHAMQTHPPSQQVSHQFGAPHSEPGSVWIGMQDQCIDGTSSRQPLATYSQLSTSPPTIAPWYRVNDRDVAAILAEQQQQQHASVLIHDSSNQSLPWSTDASYDNGFND